MESGVIVGEKVRRLREMRGWSQRQLADFSHVSNTYINQLERGKVPRASMQKIGLIARGLNVPLSELAVSAEPYDVRAEETADLAYRMALLVAQLEITKPEEMFRRIAGLPVDGQKIVDRLVIAVSEHYREFSANERAGRTFEPAEPGEPVVLPKQMTNGNAAKHEAKNG